MYSFQTVLGIVDEKKMDHTQPHEHLYIVGTVDQIRCKDTCINNFAASMEELKSYKLAGGGAVTDANPIATGRDAISLRDLSKLTGVNIIATTGYHIPKFYPENHWIWSTNEEKLENLFEKEITQGMYEDGTWFRPEYQTNIKAGLIKAAITSEGLTNTTKRLLTAVGKASIHTGAPVMLHTEAVDVLEAIDLLCGKIGVSEKNLLVCHVDRQASDYSIHEAVASTGVYMEYDTITMTEFHNVASEIKLLRHMINKGFLDQILISTDPTTDRLKNYCGKVGMDYILTEFIPLLMECGFSDEEIYRITHLNPWRALSMKSVN
jgi:predicted metal-dependent phosphotriesterase family hydrolase